jgi:hypothetical protein
LGNLKRKRVQLKALDADEKIIIKHIIYEWNRMGTVFIWLTISVADSNEHGNGRSSCVNARAFSKGTLLHGGNLN